MARLSVEEYTNWLNSLSLEQVSDLFRQRDCKELLVKDLPQNANSKNQVYLAPDFSDLGKIPTEDVEAAVSVSKKTGARSPIFRAALRLHWITPGNRDSLAPEAKLIWYPQYPEVRFSGFLKRSRFSPGFLFAKNKRGTEADRLLVFGVSQERHVFAMAFPPESRIARQLSALSHDPYGAMYIVPLGHQGIIDTRTRLLDELCRIHRSGWLDATRLTSAGPVSCRGSNCGGYTLEAELGITANGFAEPDFHGWEVKQHNVHRFERPRRSTLTLMTPEPTAGVYATQGPAAFLARWGYPDRLGRENRLNFGGVYKTGNAIHPMTGLRLVLEGYESAKKIDSNGFIALVDSHDEIAAAWPFSKIMTHWKKKHAMTAFVPSEARNQPNSQYRYGSKVLLAEGAEFARLLEAFATSKVYYDPGIKLESPVGQPQKLKRRSQFRVSSEHLSSLYERTSVVDVCKDG